MRLGEIKNYEHEDLRGEFTKTSVDIQLL